MKRKVGICKTVAALALSAVVSVAVASAPAPAPTTLAHGRFEQVRVWQPSVQPQRIVIWFAGKGDDRHRQARIEALRADGAMVARVDVERLYQVLRKADGECVFSAGDVENFSRYLQAFLHVPNYRLPLLIGDGAGAALAYAVAAQAPTHVLAGVLSDELQPAAVPKRTICGAGVDAASGALRPVRLGVPWLVAPAAGSHDQALSRFIAAVAQARRLPRDADGDLLRGLRAAVRALGAEQGVSLPPPPADLQDLPVVEVPATGNVATDADTLAVFVSGDGGWAGLDKEVAAALTHAGIPVVGVDSLRYFWDQRTPQGFAGDLDRIIRFYAQRWQRRRVLLIGFSQGADVLPAAINQLPAATRDSLRMIALLSLGKYADYEFHVSNWVADDDDDGLAIAPELVRLPVDRTVCIYGKDDDDALCPSLKQAPRPLSLPGDHHFEGDYERLADTILQQLHASPR